MDSHSVKYHRPLLSLTVTTGARQEIARRLDKINREVGVFLDTAAELVVTEERDYLLRVNWGEDLAWRGHQQVFFDRAGKSVPPMVYVRSFYMLSMSTESIKRMLESQPRRAKAILSFDLGFVLAGPERERIRLVWDA